MFRIMVFWDSREANRPLVEFINELDETLCLYQIEPMFLQIDHQHAPQSGKIKPSMRALIDFVHCYKPHLLMCFGSETNMLARLVKPALKCEVSFNRLPEHLEDDSSKVSQIGFWLKRFMEYRSWDHEEERNEFIYFGASTTKIVANRALVFDGDPMAPVFSRLSDESQFEILKIAAKQENYPAEFQSKESGLLLISETMPNYELLIDIANANGLFVLCISDSGKGVRNGENGWLIESTNERRLINCLINWRTMGDEARRVLSYHARDYQSYHSGLHYFCHTLGLIPSHQSIKNKIQSIY
ncbi:hypothetical protein [Marinomonas pollencensis]|uniref:Glycosyl transferase family 1 n=1 Tax=Marinomonas pollencensis TaxID=491954 RepID=A0A3E0DKK7_9GAMM|nr:hypothetical protein [Marinomonas pollencensis]REG83169.1 hypothetical protein DFP81_10623 [Marinomonas pollencensis]